MRNDRNTQSLDNRQQQLIEEFLQLSEWAERYQYLIELGGSLPPMPTSWRTDHNRVPECRGDTFLARERRDGLLFLHAASDTPILAGVLALIVEVYSGMPPSEILRYPPVLLDQIGLTQNLSPHRRGALLRIHERLVVLATNIEMPRRLAS